MRHITTRTTATQHSNLSAEAEKRGITPGMELKRAVIEEARAILQRPVEPLVTLEAPDYAVQSLG